MGEGWGRGAINEMLWFLYRSMEKSNPRHSSPTPTPSHLGWGAALCHPLFCGNAGEHPNQLRLQVAGERKERAVGCNEGRVCTRTRAWMSVVLRRRKDASAEPRLTRRPISVSRLLLLCKCVGGVCCLLSARDLWAEEKINKYPSNKQTMSHPRDFNLPSHATTTARMFGSTTKLDNSWHRTHRATFWRYYVYCVDITSFKTDKVSQDQQTR